MSSVTPVSDDDLFSKLFELFNQQGPVNLKLAVEVARHLSGDRQPIEPWAAEEFRELTRLAEFRVEQVAPFPVAPAPDILPVDAREWAERNLEGLAYAAEPFAGMIDLDQAGPAADMLKPLGPAIVGMQLGTLVGSLSNWAMASFDAGIPVSGERPITYVVPTIDRFTTEHGLDARDVRLWVALNEAAHRALFRVPFTFEHLNSLIVDYAETLKLPPERITEALGGFDPTDPQAIDPERLAAVFDSPESRTAQDELAAFLGVTAGYRRLLVDRAAGELLPRLSEMDEARDTERSLGQEAAGTAFAATFVDSEAIQVGTEFCEEVERRYGTEALTGMWTKSGHLPRASEIQDPVAWAARVLLDDLG